MHDHIRWIDFAVYLFLLALVVATMLAIAFTIDDAIADIFKDDDA